MRVVELRAATIDDSESIWRWNNEPSVRAVSLDPRPIERADHDCWMAARLKDALSRLWIVVGNGEDRGVARVQRDRAGDPGRVSIALAPAARGAGVGQAALALVCRHDGGPLVADIIAANRASRACFEACGFRLCERAVRGDREVLTYEWRSVDAIAI